MPDTVTIPETVTIPAEELVAVAADLLSLSDLFARLNGWQGTSLNEWTQSLAWRLLAAVAPSPVDGRPLEFDQTDPIVVEAYARSHDNAVQTFAAFVVDADAAASEAAAIRECGHAFGPDSVNDWKETLKRREASSG